jgi:hypothetical protein
MDTNHTEVKSSIDPLTWSVSSDNFANELGLYGVDYKVGYPGDTMSIEMNDHAGDICNVWDASDEVVWHTCLPLALHVFLQSLKVRWFIAHIDADVAVSIRARMRGFCEGKSTFSNQPEINVLHKDVPCPPCQSAQSTVEHGHHLWALYEHSCRLSVFNFQQAHEN